MKEEIRKKIESLFETFKTAVFQKEVGAFVSIYADDIRAFDMWVLWSYDGLAAWREMAQGWFGSLGTDRVVVTFDEIRIEASEELATASAFVRFAALAENGEELRHMHNRLTWVARKKEDAWKIFHQHTSSPVDFGTMKVMLQKH